jgi:hypothetical protein
MTKQCRRCKQIKSAADFSPDRANRDGLKSYCKPCVAERKRVWRTQNLARAREQEAAYRERHPYQPHPARPVLDDWATQHKVRKRIQAAKDQATRFGASVNDLTFDEWLGIESKQGGECFYCGRLATLEIEHKTPLAVGGANTASNVVGACRPCNFAKRLRTAEQFFANLCINDHEQIPENVYTYPDGKKTACKLCRADSLRRYRQKNPRSKK